MSWNFGAVGAMASAANTDVTPLNVAYPTGITAGQILLLIARIPTASATFTPSDITTSLYSRATNGSIELFAKIATGSESGNITLSSSANARVNAQIARFTGGPTTLTGIVHASANSGGSAATGLPYAGLTITQPNTLVLIAGGKQVNVTSFDDVAGFTEIGEGNGGTTNCLVWNYAIQTTAADLTAGSWTVNGDSSAARSTISVALLAGAANLAGGLSGGRRLKSLTGCALTR